MSQEAFDVASTLKRDRHSIQLAEPVTEEQAELFRRVVHEYITQDFELQLCADGLFLYRDNAIEDAIIEAAKKDIQLNDPMIAGFDEIMRASSTAYKHYIPALNILFALVESELHSRGRNITLYWAQPIGRTDMVRVKNAQSPNEQSSLTTFGEVTEMQLQRFVGKVSIGARIDGGCYPDVPKAFADACSIFDEAYHNLDLWSFLEQYSNAWSNLQTELYESSLALSWSIIERDLVSQTAGLVNGLPQGNVLRTTQQGASQALSARDERKLRSRLAQGESPMAGTMISILRAHSVPLHPKLQTVKTARNNHQHQGALVHPQSCSDALEICADACSRVHGVGLNCRLQANAHLGITC